MSGLGPSYLIITISAQVPPTSPEIFGHMSTVIVTLLQILIFCGALHIQKYLEFHKGPPPLTFQTSAHFQSLVNVTIVQSQSIFKVVNSFNPHP